MYSLQAFLLFFAIFVELLAILIGLFLTIQIKKTLPVQQNTL